MIFKLFFFISFVKKNKMKQNFILFGLGILIPGSYNNEGIETIVYLKD